MDFYFPLSGEIKPLQFPGILFQIYKKSVAGILTVSADTVEKSVLIQNGRVVFATSSSREDSLGSYLMKQKIITKEKAKQADGYMEKKGVRFGRALVELGYIDYRGLWTGITGQLRGILISLFDTEGATFDLDTESVATEENITLDVDIPTLILQGMREYVNEETLFNRLKTVQHVYPFKSEFPSILDLEAHEKHVLDLVKRESSLKKIIASSELLKFDTLRILHTFLIMEMISTEKVEFTVTGGRGKRVGVDPHRDVTPLEGDIAPVTSFFSFEDALKHFNMKYELVYRVLSKEIGPIALSILAKAVQDIAEKLPFFLKKVSLKAEGGLEEAPILKSVWYYDFEQYCGEFVKGLEEILYAEVYAVKKHLGVEYEQQVLKWIN
jgi:hypothetical protein